jgi:hypothetical protein
VTARSSDPPGELPTGGRPKRPFRLPISKNAIANGDRTRRSTTAHVEARSGRSAARGRGRLDLDCWPACRGLLLDIECLHMISSTSMRKMGNVKVLAYIRPDQKAWLDKQAAKTGAPFTELIRRAIDAYKKVRA